MTCLPPISTKGLGSDDISDLVKKTRDQMMEVFTTTTKEVEDWAAKEGRSILVEASS